MYNEFYRHKKSDAAKWVIVFLLIILLAAGVASSLFIGIKNMKNAEEEKVPKITEEQETNKPTATAGAMKLSFGDMVITALSESGENVSVSKPITAIVTPPTAKNAQVDWSVEWGSGQSGIVTEYIVVTPETDGSTSATVTCKQPFDGEIVIVCTTREGGYIATCTVTFSGQPTELVVTCNVAEENGAYRLGIGNTYEYGIEMKNPFNQVGEKFNSVAVSITGVGQVQLGNMEHYKASGNDVWYESTFETVELDTLKEAFITAEITAEGKLQITTLSAIESFYRGTQRLDGGRTIGYDGKFHSYVSDCYFNVTLTEINSGCSKTVKVILDESGTTGVELSDTEMEF